MDELAVEMAGRKECSGPIDEIKARISLLEKELLVVKKEVAEAMKIPSSQTAQQAYKVIADIEARAKPLFESIQAKEKALTNAHAAAEKKDSDIGALLSSAKERDSEASSKIADTQKKMDGQLEALAKLLEDSGAKIRDQQHRIEEMIPGATSARLATAFKERKDDVAKGGLGWIVMLIISALGLVAAGIVSWAIPGEGFFASLPARTIIVIGLLLIEEFARRNYNIKRRLAESYGYKEVLSRSFHGYKEAMTNIELPADESGNRYKADESLVEVFLQTLADEPGKSIFDKEKAVTFSEKLAEKLVEVKTDDNSLIAQMFKGNLLAKITWPLVALASILVGGACIIIWLCR